MLSAHYRRIMWCAELKPSDVTTKITLQEAFPGPASQLGSPETEGGPSKPKSRKRYDIPKTASCHVCGESAGPAWLVPHSCCQQLRLNAFSVSPLSAIKSNVNCLLYKYINSISCFDLNCTTNTGSKQGFFRNL